MKLTAFLLLMACMQVSAAGYGQRISISGHNMNLKAVFREIQKQSGYSVLYFDKDVESAKKVSVEVKNADLVQVLNQVFAGQPLTYSIVGNTIVVKEKSTQNGSALLPRPIIVKGRLLNEKEEPVAGITVTIKGTKIATPTNTNGEFTLPNVDENATLVFTGVTIETREVKIGGRGELGNIVVKTKVEMGEEITVRVNTGYQTLPRERATGAFDIIGLDKIEKRIFTNAAEALEGQAPGLSTFKGNFNLRGINTFSTEIGTQPLLVIDGLPTERRLEDVNINDIETITILKDAAAASIYGVRAANGVVVITTKGGKFTDKVKTTVQLTSDWRWIENPSLRDYHYATTSDFIDYDLEIIKRDAIKANRSELDNLNLNLKGIGQAGTSSNNINYYTPLQMARLQLLNGTLSQANYDALLAKWRTADYRQEYMDLVWKTPLRQSYNLSINSSGKNQSTFASLNFIEDGQQNRYNKNEYIKGYIKSSQMLNKWFSFDIGADVQYNHNVSVNSSYADMTMLEPYTSILDENGNKVYRDYVEITGMQGGFHINPKVQNAIAGLPQFESYKFNVLDELNDNLETRNYYNVRSFARFNFTISNNLRFSTSGEYEFAKDKTEEFRSKTSYYYRFLRNRFATNAAVNGVIPEGGRMVFEENSSNSWVWRNQIDFNKSIGGDHQISAAGGFELKETAMNIPVTSVYYGYDPQALTYTMLNNSDIYNVGYKQSYIYNNNTGLPGAVIDGSYVKLLETALLKPTLTSTLNRYVGYYALGGYTYKGKYGVTGSIRVDQTNLFGTDPKYRYRPLWSAGVKWNMAKESFLNDIGWVSLLDFRASYGLTGNVDQTTTPFLVASLANQSTYTPQSYQYASISSAPNPLLRWEKTTSYNAGFDYSLFRGVLNGKLDFYYKISEDLLGTKEVNFTSGYATQRVNSGAMSNKGVEFSVSSPWYRSKDLTVTSTLMVSYNKNTVTKTYYNPTQASHLAIGGYLVNGKPYDALYAYRYGGLTSGGTDYQNGVPVILRADGTSTSHFNSNGTLTLDGSTTMGTEDVVYMGTLTPLVSASFTQNIRYKDVELSALFLYYGGHQMYLPSFGFSITDGNEDWITKAWTPNKTNNTVPKSKIYYEPGISVVNLGSLEGMYIRSTDRIAKGDFIRLRNIALSYTLPAKLSQKLRIDRLKVSGQINNPWIWSAAGKQYDSEVQSSTSGISLRNWGLPTPTTYLLRFDVTF